jgi:predicted dehydrogenase
MDVVGVAEPIEFRRDKLAKKHKIEKKYQFNTWEDVFKVDKFADAVIITTPDDLHYGPAMKALEMGYDLLLEKPIAQTWEECRDIRDMSKKYNNIVAVCHVLRYTPYFRKMKEAVDSGVLGRVISVQHLEPVKHKHMAHSYVRGNWRKTSDNPMIMAKSCHDLDILRWMIDKKCKYISSFGSLSWFKEENAPKGSTKRCTDGCAVEHECPYSALQIYYRDRTWLSHFDLPKDKSKQGDVIMKYLKETNYGVCVYRSDNDVVDHQIVGMEFEDGVTANFSMEAFTSYGKRRTRIFGPMGDIVGDGDVLVIANFKTGEIEKWVAKEHAKIDSGHSGGDFGLVKDFLQAVGHHDAGILTSTIDVSMDSHYMAFKAEESRVTRKTIEL